MRRTLLLASILFFLCGIIGCSQEAKTNVQKRFNEHQFQILFFETFYQFFGIRNISVAGLYCDRGNSPYFCYDNECNIEKIRKECAVFDELHYEKYLIIFIRSGPQFFVLTRSDKCMQYIGEYNLLSKADALAIRRLGQKAAKKIKEPCPAPTNS
ncbi:MAG: hypothetical protein AAB795_01620 [Patescibacteria group bacterium]